MFSLAENKVYISINSTTFFTISEYQFLDWEIWYYNLSDIINISNSAFVPTYNIYRISNGRPLFNLRFFMYPKSFICLYISLCIYICMYLNRRARIHMCTSILALVYISHTARIRVYIYKCACVCERTRSCSIQDFCLFRFRSLNSVFSFIR